MAVAPHDALIRHELRAHKKLTLQLRWDAYRQQQPEGHCVRCYWIKRRDVVLRDEYRAGKRLAIDSAAVTCLSTIS